MKAASADLIAMLATSKTFYMVETYTFTLADGTVLVFTSGDVVPSSTVSGSEPQAPIIT